jgi:prolyl 4-hydroxylase
MRVIHHPRRRPWLEGDSLDATAPLAWTVDDFLPAGECDAMIDRMEREGITPAPVTTHRGAVMRPDIRNNDRASFDDPALAKSLFERVRPHVPKVLQASWHAVGCNERFRAYRYEPGQYFAPHYDGCFRRSADEESLLTFLVYLNGDFMGGETNFLDHATSIVPKKGMALLFQHRLLHEGARLVSGTKYVLRSDVMYRRDPMWR